jgi:hypothetical protein
MEAVKTGLIDWAIAGTVLPGQNESGDLHLVKTTPEGALVAVVDGLGHGGEAAEAARGAVRSLERQGAQPMISLVKSCHGALTGTRGVVMSVAAFNARDETLMWVGVGNVEGLLLRAHAAVNPRRESLLLRGRCTPTTQGDPPQPLADHILAHWARGTDDALVLVARWVGVTT